MAILKDLQTSLNDSLRLNIPLSENLKVEIQSFIQLLSDFEDFLKPSLVASESHKVGIRFFTSEEAQDSPESFVEQLRTKAAEISTSLKEIEDNEAFSNMLTALDKLSTFLNQLPQDIKTACPLSQNTLFEILQAGDEAIVFNNAVFTLYERVDSSSVDLIGWIRRCTLRTAVSNDGLTKIFDEVAKQVSAEELSALSIVNRNDIKRFINPTTNSLFLIEEMIKIIHAVYVLKQTYPAITLSKNTEFHRRYDEETGREAIRVVDGEAADIEAEMQRQQEAMNVLREANSEQRRVAEMRESFSAIEDVDKRNVIVQLVLNGCLSEAIEAELRSDAYNKRDQYFNRLMDIQNWLLSLVGEEESDVARHDLLACLDMDREEYIAYIIAQSDNLLCSSEDVARLLNEYSRDVEKTALKKIWDDILDDKIDLESDAGRLLSELSTNGFLLFLSLIDIEDFEDCMRDEDAIEPFFKHFVMCDDKSLLRDFFIKIEIDLSSFFALMINLSPEARKFILMGVGLDFLKQLAAPNKKITAFLKNLSMGQFQVLVSVFSDSGIFVDDWSLDDNFYDLFIRQVNTLPESDFIALLGQLDCRELVNSFLEVGFSFSELFFNLDYDKKKILMGFLGIGFIKNSITSGDDIAVFMIGGLYPDNDAFLSNIGIQCIKGALRNGGELARIARKLSMKQRRSLVAQLGIVFLRELFKDGQEIGLFLSALDSQDQMPFMQELGIEFIREQITVGGGLDNFLSSIVAEDAREYVKNGLGVDFMLSKLSNYNEAAQLLSFLKVSGSERDELHQGIERVLVNKQNVDVDSVANYLRRMPVNDRQVAIKANIASCKNFLFYDSRSRYLLFPYFSYECRQLLEPEIDSDTGEVKPAPGVTSQNRTLSM